MDDEDAVRTMCRRALEIDGATVIEAPSGEAALGIV
jgi:CheY-like chemotaxis protein